MNGTEVRDLAKDTSEAGTLTAHILDAATRIVCANINRIQNANEAAAFFSAVYAAVTENVRGGTAPAEPEKDLVPAVSIKKSVQPDYIICLEDGKRFKSLKRHIGTHYGLTPEDYRRKWSLPRDYPMVAPNYASQRSALAKQMGLGRKDHSRKGGRGGRKAAAAQRSAPAAKRSKRIA
jgi:predicted transcriptional regulator